MSGTTLGSGVTALNKTEILAPSFWGRDGQRKKLAIKLLLIKS